MKQLIVMTAVLMLLLLFPLQYALEQSNYYEISEFQKIVYNAKEEAKIKGYFSDEILDSLKNNITSAFKNVEASEIIIHVTETPKYRTDAFDERELIYYKIAIPIDQFIAGNHFWGISDTQNSGYYVIENYTVSERLKP